MLDEKLKSRIEKIKALAERGVGGEQETAKKKLDQLLKANGLTLKSLESEEKQFYLFSYSNKHTKKLLGQIIYKVLGASEPINYYKVKNTRNKLGIYCTPAQKVEIDLDYEFYLNVFDEELTSFMSAFIQKQDLFPSDSPSKNVDLNDLTPAERERIEKEEAYRKSMKKRTRREMIEQKS